MSPMIAMTIIISRIVIPRSQPPLGELPRVLALRARLGPSGLGPAPLRGGIMSARTRTCGSVALVVDLPGVDVGGVAAAARLAVLAVRDHGEALGARRRA